MANELGTNPEINPQEHGINPELGEQHEVAPAPQQEDIETPSKPLTPAEQFHPIPVEMPDEKEEPVLSSPEISQQERDEKMAHDVYSPAGELDPSDATENLMHMINGENPDIPHQ